MPCRMRDGLCTSRKVRASLEGYLSPPAQMLGRRHIFFNRRNDNVWDRLSNLGSRGVRMNSAGVRRPIILIVEDDFFLRMYAAEMIQDAGFDIVEAGNADEAIAILEARPDIRVVFTDIQMPGSMDGLKLARFVRGRWPPIQIVATSGFVNVGKDDLPEGSRFLPKPYRPDQIVATLREMTAI